MAYLAHHTVRVQVETERERERVKEGERKIEKVSEAQTWSSAFIGFEGEGRRVLWSHSVLMSLKHKNQILKCQGEKK